MTKKWILFSIFSLSMFSAYAQTNSNPPAAGQIELAVGKYILHRPLLINQSMCTVAYAEEMERGYLTLA